MTLISLIAKAVCGHVVDKMAAETSEKRPLRDQAAHEHENVLSDDLYSVKSVREERKLKGSKWVNMPQSLYTTRMPCLVQYGVSIPYQGWASTDFMGMHAYLGSLSGAVTGRASFQKFKSTALHTRRAGDDVVSRGQTLFRCCDCAQVSGHARLEMAYHSCIPGM